MRLMCKIEVCNRAYENNNKTKSQKACLSMGRFSSKEDDIFLIMQTLQNKSGVRYKLSKNIEIVFTKYISEGKITIRLKDPTHDLLIQTTDIVLLKTFAHVLKRAYTKPSEAPLLKLGEINAKKISEAMQNKIVIKSATRYPTLEGFHRKTTELHIAGLERRSFDRNILKLQQLRILNLSDNQISSLPKDLGTLQHLQELNVAQNLLHKCPKSKWTWMEELTISKNLKLLDLSANQLTEVPASICKLSALVTLKINSNLLERLPQSLGCLEHLKFLDVSKNQIKILPGSIRNIKFTTLNVSFNSFINIENRIECRPQVCPTLVQLAAKMVFKLRIRCDASILPYSLVLFMNRAEICVCGDPCYNNFIRRSLEFPPSRFEGSVVTSGFSMLPFDCFFCSVRCHRRYCG